MTSGMLILVMVGASVGYFAATKAFDGVKKVNHAIACHVRRDCPPKKKL